MAWAVGDWVVFDRAVGQIKKLDDEWASFSDGFFETSGRLASRFRPLTLRNKNVVETFEVYYNRLHEIDGEAGFNYPDISSYFSQLARDAIDNEGDDEPFMLAQQFVHDARDHKSEIQGIPLFRPKPRKAATDR